MGNSGNAGLGRGSEMKLTYIYHIGLYLNLCSFSLWTTNSIIASLNLVFVAILIEFIIYEMRNENPTEK